jgi:hypothetical protein
LLALAAFGPALAAAQSGAEDEYELSPNIPSSDGGNQQVNSGGGAPSSGSGGDSGTPSAGATVGEPAGGGEATQGGGGKSDGSKGDGNGANASQAAPAPNEVPTLNADSSDDGGAPVLLILLAAIAAICTGVAVWRLRRTRRRLRFLAPGERQWFRLALAADRAGVGPRPTETIYEYASWLEEQIPRHRPEIQTIAGGKVWQSYSGRSMSGEALARIERAWKRLELPMVWLAIQRRVASLLPSFRGRKRPS